MRVSTLLPHVWKRKNGGRKGGKKGEREGRREGGREGGSDSQQKKGRKPAYLDLRRVPQVVLPPFRFHLIPFLETLVGGEEGEFFSLGTTGMTGVIACFFRGPATGGGLLGFPVLTDLKGGREGGREGRMNKSWSIWISCASCFHNQPPRSFPLPSVAFSLRTFVC